MADQPSALHATRVRLSSHGQRWTGPLAAAQAPAHAHRDFSLLPVWKGSSFQRPCGNFLRLAAHCSRSGAIPHGARGEVAQSSPSVRRSRPRGAPRLQLRNPSQWCYVWGPLQRHRAHQTFPGSGRWGVSPTIKVFLSHVHRRRYLYRKVRDNRCDGCTIRSRKEAIRTAAAYPLDWPASCGWPGLTIGLLLVGFGAGAWECSARDVPFFSWPSYGIGSAAGAAACRFLTIVVRVISVGCSVPWGKGKNVVQRILRCPDCGSDFIWTEIVHCVNCEFQSPTGKQLILKPIHPTKVHLTFSRHLPDITLLSHLNLQRPPLLYRGPCRS